MSSDPIGAPREGARAPIVSDLGNASFSLWFPAFRWLTRHVPPEWLARLSYSTVERAMWARNSVREAMLDNYAAVLGREADAPRVEETARAMLSQHSRLWIDLLRYSGRGAADAHRLVSKRSGEDVLLDAQRGGKGGIILTAHVGNFELGGLFLKQMGLEVSAVYAPDPSPVVEEHRERARRMMGVEGIPVTRSAFAFVPILRALKENRIVAMQGDRDFAGTGRRLPFLGRDASFPVGPFRLAAVSGAPLFPAFVLHEEDGSYETRVHAPIPIAKGAGEDEAIAPAMASFVSLLEKTIRERPTQWYLFKRFWE